MQVLSSEPQPNGLTRITVDIDGVTRGTVSLSTAIVHTVNETELLALVTQTLATQRPNARP